MCAKWTIKQKSIRFVLIPIEYYSTTFPLWFVFIKHFMGNAWNIQGTRWLWFSLSLFLGRSVPACIFFLCIDLNFFFTLYAINCVPHIRIHHKKWWACYYFGLWKRPWNAWQFHIHITSVCMHARMYMYTCHTVINGHFKWKQWLNTLTYCYYCCYSHLLPLQTHTRPLSISLSLLSVLYSHNDRHVDEHFNLRN